MMAIVGTENVVVNLTRILCGECGGVYAIAERFRQQCHQKGTGWKCPYCKTEWGYFENGINARLKKQVEELKEQTNRQGGHIQDLQFDKAHLAHQRNGLKGALRKEQNRLKNGVCPCCNRHFENLHRHMTNKHPHYGKHAKAKPSR